jgi:hypothetical protein
MLFEENFPGICAIFLDWILRNFNENPNEFREKLLVHLEGTNPRIWLV